MDKKKKYINKQCHHYQNLYSGTADFVVYKLNTDGIADSSFDGDGKATIDIGGRDDIPYSLTVDNSGSVFIGGYSAFRSSVHGYAVAKLNSTGAIDASFNGDGKFRYRFDKGPDYGNNSHIQADGKIIVTGVSYAEERSELTSTRFNSNGTLDVGFGTNGVVKTSLNDSYHWLSSSLLKEDELYVTGFNYSNNQQQLIIAKYDVSGALNPSFNRNGIITYSAQNTYFHSAVLLQTSAGKLLVAGHGYMNNQNGVYSMRFNTDGTLDITYGTNGIAFAASNQFYSISKAVLQPDDKIVFIANNNHFVVGRLNATGTSFDASLDGDGIVNTTLGNSSYPATMQIRQDGKIIAAGNYSTYNGSYWESKSVVVQYLQNGSLDAEFGTNGIKDFNYIGITTSHLYPSGKLLLSGHYGNLTRLNTDGSLDNGLVNGAYFSGYASSLGVQSDGKLVLGSQGYSNYYNTDVDFTVARYNLTLTLSCPANKQVAASSSCSTIVNNIDPVVNPAKASVEYTLTGATTGSGSGTASGQSFNIGVTTVTYIAVDDTSKTCSFTVTIKKGTYYRDADGDGYGNASDSTQECSTPTGYVTNSTDCDDTKVSVYPGATEVCNGLDDDCDGLIDEGVKTTFYRDADSDGFGNPSSTTEDCSAPSGYVANNSDCDDTKASVYPGATEVCNGIDDDCDGLTDEGVKTTYYRDFDGDGYGDAAKTIATCSAPPDGYISTGNDCNDNDATIYPGAPEICDGKDNNCNGQSDEQLTCPTATAGSWRWAKTAGGPDARIPTRKLGITSDGSGNTYVTGAFTGTFVITTAAGNTTLTSEGETDVIVIKYDQFGKVVWAKRAGGTGNDLSNAIEIDKKGNLYIAGSYKTAANFGSFNLNSSAGSNNVFIAKLNPSTGEFLWAQDGKGNNNHDRGAYDIAIDNNGDAYITGIVGPGTTTFGSMPPIDGRSWWEIFIAKYNSAGTLQWLTSAGSSEPGYYSDAGNGIAVDAQGKVYITGSINGTASNPSKFGSLSATSKGTGGFHQYGFFVAKYDPAKGDWEWVKNGGSSNKNDYGRKISLDADGNIFVDGVFEGTATFDFATIESASGGSSNFVAKYRTDGRLVWVKPVAGYQYIGGAGSQVGADGNMYFAATFRGTVTVGNQTFTSTGYEDTYVACFNNHGLFQWVKHMPADHYAPVYGIDVESDGTVNYIGVLSQRQHFDCHNIFVASNSNMVVAKLGTPVAAEPPVVVASSSVICPGSTATLTITSGNLNDAKEWKWYTGSCGGTLVGTGTVLNVTPATTTTYYVRGEGTCGTPADCGTVTVTVKDTTPPRFTCPPDRTINLSGNCTFAVPDLITGLTGTDNCTSVSFTQSPAANTLVTGVHNGQDSITITAADKNGNTSKCIVILTAKDVTAPVISYCPNVPKLCYNDKNTYTIPALTATDNCTSPIVNYTVSAATVRSGTGSNASGIFNPGTSIITWTVTDGNGNSTSCTTTVVVQKVDATIPDVYAVSSSLGNPNTIYIGYGATSVTLTAQPTSNISGNTYAYKWTAGSVSGPTIDTGQSVTVNPTATTTYFVQIEDNNKCAPETQVKKQITVVDIRCGTDKVYVCEKQRNGTYLTKCISTRNIDRLTAGSYLGECGTTSASARLTSTNNPAEAVSFDKTLSVKNSFDVRVSPNPSTNYFTLKVESTNIKDAMNIRVVDVLGRVIETRTNIFAGQTLQIGNNYKPGVYIVEVMQGNNKKQLKLIKL